MLLDLFLCFVQVGLFSIGGGYAAMPMIQAKAVEYYHWLTMSEFTDLMTIAEMTPGPITVNSATFVGIRMAGIPGALVATMGCILPSLIIVSLLSWLYEKYRSMDAMQAVLACLRPAVVALIASAALTILRVVVFAGGVISVSTVQVLYVALFIIALAVLKIRHSNPILVMVCCGAVSLAASGLAGGALWLLAGRSVPLLRLLGVSFAALLLFAAALLSVQVRSRRTWAPLLVPAGWALLSLSLQLLGDRLLPLWRALPAAALFPAALAAAAVYCHELKRWLFEPREGVVSHAAG